MFAPRSLHAPARRGSGFTLIELLVVMVIIAILMAILMPMYGQTALRAKIQATNSLIRGLAAGMEFYKNEFEAYPPTPHGGGDPADDGTIFKSLMGPDGKGIIANPGTPREKHLPPFLSIPFEFIKHEGSDTIVVDSWGQPIHYFNCKAFVESGKNAEYCHNQDSFDIYSFGPDKKKDDVLIEPGKGKVEDPAKVKYVDDIKNW